MERHLSLVAKTQYCVVLMSRYSLLPPPAPATSSLIMRRARAEVTGHECPLIIMCNATCYHLSAAESAVMHVMWVFPDTIEADTI